MRRGSSFGMFKLLRACLEPCLLPLLETPIRRTDEHTESSPIFEAFDSSNVITLLP